MSNHMILTDQERNDAATFWGDYFRRGGEGEQPSAFLLDTLNDVQLRDHVMFWQIDADVNAYNPQLNERMDQVKLRELLGEVPDSRSVMKAITKVIGENNKRGVEIDDMDTGTVLILMHVMWLILGGDFYSACDEVAKLTLLHRRYNEVHPEDPLPHIDPLEGLGYAATVLYMRQSNGDDPEALQDLAAEMFGLSVDHPNVQSARNYGKGTALITQLRKLDAPKD